MRPKTRIGADNDFSDFEEFGMGFDCDLNEPRDQEQEPLNAYLFSQDNPLFATFDANATSDFEELTGS